MVLTIEKLNLKVKALEDQHGSLLRNLPSNMINYVLQYQKNLQHIDAQIALIKSQIAELLAENKKEASLKIVESKIKKIKEE